MPAKKAEKLVLPKHNPEKRPMPGKCHVCGRAEFWERDDEWLCKRCHPKY